MLDGSSHTLGPPSVFFNMFEALHFGGNREGDYGGSLLGTGHGSNGHSVEPQQRALGGTARRCYRSPTAREAGDAVDILRSV